MNLSNNIGRSGVVGLIILITAIMYLGSLKWLFTSWLNNEAYSQGFLIPIISAVLIWNKRDVFHGQSESKSPVLFIISLIIYIAGQITGAIFITTISLIPFILGIILFLKGMDAIRAVAFPVIFLIFAIPLPNLEGLTLTLQSISTVVAVYISHILAVDSSYIGCQVIMGGNIFEIAPACSGLNSIISLYTIIALLCYLITDPLIDRIVLFITVLPIAILTNGLRIAITLFIASRYSVDLAMTYFHDWGGITFYIIALITTFALLGGLRWMRRINTKQ